jgi:hypothetical protein
MRKTSKVNCNFEREPLAGPFGFKGGYLSELYDVHDDRIRRKKSG